MTKIRLADRGESFCDITKKPTRQARMGNQVIKDAPNNGTGGQAELVKQPGKPVVRLASERKSYRNVTNLF